MADACARRGVRRRREPLEKHSSASACDVIVDDGGVDGVVVDDGVSGIIALNVLGP